MAKAKDMTREQRLEGKIRLIKVVDHDEPYQNLEVPVHHTDLTDLSLNLALLVHELIDQFTLLSPGDTVVVRRSRKARFTSGRRKLVLELAERELELVLSFLLVYHRDGLADVDHLDIEVGTNESDELDVTITVDRFKPPISGEEAKRILALDE